MSDAMQEAVDRYYWANGPCCAGCDHWEAVRAAVGTCAKSTPMPGDQRTAMLGITSISMNIGAGHPFTQRDHRCGDFSDAFDWSSLPLGYRKRIGVS